MSTEEKKIKLGSGRLYVEEDGKRLPFLGLTEPVIMVWKPADPEVLRCVQMDCYDNDDGICQSIDEHRAPELGDKCPSYEED